MNIWPDWLKAIQLKARYLFGVWVLGLLILSLPKSTADMMRLTSIRDAACGYIWIGTLAGFIFWLVALIPIFQNRRNARMRRAAVLSSLDSLSAFERALLAYCLVRQRQTLLLPMASSVGNVAAGLCQKGLMVEADGAQNALAWPHTIPHFVWSELVFRRSEFLPQSEEEKAALLRYCSDVDKVADGQRGALDSLW